MNIHLYPSVLKNETRMLKIASSLSKHRVFNEIRIVGISAVNLPAYEYLGNGIHIHRIAPVFGGEINGSIGKLARTLGWYIAVLIWVRNYSPICLNCHSLPVLPLSTAIKFWKRCKLVYDTHELETETIGCRGLRKIIAKFIEASLIYSCEAVCVVNPSLALWYKDQYGLKRVWVVRNLPVASDRVPGKSGLLRKKINLDPPDAILFIYQGILAEGRGIHNLIDAFKTANGMKHIVFMGYGPLDGVVQQAAIEHNNIHFLPAVAPEVVKDYTVDADIGLCLIENTCLSYYLCAPNKLFEYVACGVPAVVSNFPEMSCFVDSHSCGWKLEPSLTEISRLVESIDRETLFIKQQNALHVGENYNWENEVPELLKMYNVLGLFTFSIKNL